jgi:hypothetical protein
MGAVDLGTIRALMGDTAGDSFGKRSVEHNVADDHAAARPEDSGDLTVDCSLVR